MEIRRRKDVRPLLGQTGVDSMRRRGGDYSNKKEKYKRSRGGLIVSEKTTG